MQDFFSSKVLTKLINGFYKIIILEIIVSIYNFPLIFSLFFIPIQRQSILIFILLSATLFPSLTSIFRLLWNQEDDMTFINSFKAVGRYYKEDFKRNLLFSVIFTLALFVIVFDFFYLRNFMSGPWLDIVLFLCLLIFGILFLLFSILSSHFFLSLKDTLSNALFLLYSHFFSSLTTVIFSYLFLLVTKVTNLPVLQVTVAGLLALYTFSRFSAIVKKELPTTV